MIHDRLDNWGVYFDGSSAKTIETEILAALESTESFEKILIPGELLIRTMSYALCPENSPELIIESHKHWIDIQFSILGSEGIDVFDSGTLNHLSYNLESDFFTYETDLKPAVTIRNHPSYFSIFFPGDAHRPKMVCEGHTKVHKGVVKMSTQLYEKMRRA